MYLWTGQAVTTGSLKMISDFNLDSNITFSFKIYIGEGNFQARKVNPNDQC